MITDCEWALGAPNDGVDACDELALVERLGEIVVGPEAEALDLGIELGEARQDQDRRLDAAGPEAAQDLVAVHVGQHEIQNDDVVVVEFADLESVFAHIGRVADETFLLEHQLDRAGSGLVVLNQQNAHCRLLGNVNKLTCVDAAKQMELTNSPCPDCIQKWRIGFLIYVVQSTN